MSATDELPFDRILGTLKTAVGALRDAQIPFALAGGIAAWARGRASARARPRLLRQALGR